jgi:hypothetical protein
MIRSTGCDKGDGLLVRFSSALPVLLETEFDSDGGASRACKITRSPQNQPSSRDSKEASTAYTGFPRREASHRFESADVFRSSEALPNEKARLKRDFPGRFVSFFKSVRRVDRTRSPQNQPSSRDSKEASTAYTGFPRREASHRLCRCLQELGSTAEREGPSQA